MKHRTTTDLSRGLMPRRTLLGALGATGALLLVGCGDDGGGTTDDGTTGTSGTTGTTGASTGDDPTTGGAGSTTGDGSSTDPTTGDPVECGDPPATWASGGTAAMTAKACYPDPFAGGVVACPLLCETTAGPCTADALERQDVSEGWAGLPVRLALLVVDADTCAPVPGARVEIWHTQRTGVYSGVTPNPQMCYGDDPDAANYQYFRGLQTAGDDGRVDFDTCFPGWYPGRAIHIHFRVHVGDDARTVSQLFFPEDITEEIFASHPDYQEFGQPNTHLDDDSIIGGEDDPSDYVLTVARMPDGAMLASKVIGIRASLEDPSCDVAGGGMGMPPPP